MPFHVLRPVVAVLVGIALGACASAPVVPTVELGAPTPLAGFCLEAQRVVVKTAIVPALELHTDFDAYVKSKTAIEPLTIHQFNWPAPTGAPADMTAMVSCKLKSADHLNTAFGPNSAGPMGSCQEFNRLNYQRLRAALGSTAEAVVFDAKEDIRNAANPGMTGPDWLAPYTMAYRDDAGVLHVRSKGFRVDWLDPAVASLPGRFRGVQYCHFIAPDYLKALLQGQAQPGAIFGRDVSAMAPPNAGVPGAQGPGGPH
jgi:hypothetical protein